MSDEEWTWPFRAPAKRAYDDLDPHARERITDKLDEIVADQWRDPDNHLEPLTGAPHSKLPVGQFRVGVECNHDERVLDVYPIERRGGASTPGDDRYCRTYVRVEFRHPGAATILIQLRQTV